MNKRWFELSEPQLEHELSTSSVNGLSKKEAAKRRKNGSNVVFRLPHGSFTTYFKDILSDSSSIILILAALLASLFQNTMTSYIIAGIILINAFIVVFTYVKAHRILESMGEYSLPGAKVIRDGHLYLVSMNSLVPGDLIYLKAGDIVPADVRIIGAEGFFVSERGITGNASAIRKSPQNVSPDNDSNENMFNIAFATSVVLKGTARAIVVETGENTLVARTNNNELDLNHDYLDVFVMLKKYGSKISVLMFIMVFVIMFIEIIMGLNTRGIYDIFLGGMSLAVAAMTEFYTAFGYIIVACGLFGARTYQQKRSNSVIMKNINSIQKLRDINCVIFPKEGFLTEKSKTVEMMYTSGQIYRTKDYDKANEGFSQLLEAAAISTGVYMKGALSSSTAINRTLSQDEQALIETAKRYNLYNISLNDKYPLVMHRNAVNNRLSYSVVMNEGEKYGFNDCKMLIYARGLARSVIKKCKSYSIGSMSIPFDCAIRNDLLSIISEYEKINTTVLAIATVESTKNKIFADGYTVENEKSMTLLGLIALRSPLIDGCSQTVQNLSDSSIKLILNSTTSSNEDILTAKTLGICKSDAEILDEQAFESMTDEALRHSIDKYSVYYGLKNASLRKLISVLKEKGYNVAYCADNLSEISVLECADIGCTYADIPENISLNSVPGDTMYKKLADTSDALRFKSDLIIPTNVSKKRRDGGIRSIEKGVLTSKLIYKNLMNMFAYFANVQFARLFIVLYGVFTKTIILTPIQILIGGLVFDFLAILSISFSKPGANTANDYMVARNEMKSLNKLIMRNSLFGIFWAVITIFIPMLFSLTGKSLTGNALSSAAFISFILLQMLTLAETKRNTSIFNPKTFSINPFYVASVMFSLIFIGLCMIVPSLGTVTSIVVPDIISLLSIALINITVVGLHEIYKAILNK